MREHHPVGSDGSVATDAAMFLEGTSTSHFDGSAGGGNWTGTAHASTSTARP
jgi:hypothetical protein